MKVVVIGGTGLIGSQVVEKLDARGHEVQLAALQTGTNTITGEGVDDTNLVPGPDAWLASTTYHDLATANGS